MNEPTPAPDEVLDPTSTDVRSDMEQPATLVHRNPYDVEVPVTLRERLAYARALSAAGILPRDYASKPANVLVAGEMGRELGLSTVQSVMMLNVVEGRPTLGASGVRAVVLRAGHRMRVTERKYSAHGVPVSVTVTGWRYEDGEEPDEDTRTYTIDMAARAGLCRVLRDDAGEVTGVRARSQRDNPLPWELHTERMLEARATTWLGDTLFADVTMGLAVEREPEGGAIITTAEQVTTPAKPSERAQQVLQQVKPQRRTDLPDDYDPVADLEDAGADWWEHAGAQVSRRNKQQLAADRIAKWVADHPGEAEKIDLPMPPAVTPEPDPLADSNAAPQGDEPDDEAPVVGEIVDDMPDDEVDEDDEPTPGDPWGDAAAREQALAEVDEEPKDDVPDEAPGDDGPALDPVPDDATPDLGGGDEPTAADLLAEIDAAADEVGRTRQALMVRWIASHRKNPEDATAEELLPFVEQLRQTLAARKG